MFAQQTSSGSYPSLGNSYATADLYMAAYVEASGVPHRQIDRRDPRRVRFVFPKIEESLLNAWSTASAMVNAIAYSNSIKKLKRLIHEEE